MRYLIVNADDFGITKGVSDGIIEAAEYGVVTSTTMFANTEHFDYAVSSLKKNDRLGVGVHLTLTFGVPVLEDVHSLVGKNRRFFREAEFKANLKAMSTDEIEREFTAQIEKVIDAGIRITHLDTHQNIQILPVIGEIVSSLAIEYGVGVRNLGKLPREVKTTDIFTDKFYGETSTELNFKLLIKKFEEYNSMEMMCHPGHFDLELMNISRYAKKRSLELAVLSKYELVAHLERFKIERINFGQLP